MGPIEFGTGVTNNTQVQNPGKLFPADTEEIYAVFPFSGMENGLDYKIIWYQDGTELWRDEGIWEWGDQAKLFSFFKFPGPGSFKVEVQVNDSVLTSGLFEVQ